MTELDDPDPDDFLGERRIDVAIDRAVIRQLFDSGYYGKVEVNPFTVTGATGGEWDPVFDEFVVTASFDQGVLAIGSLAAWIVLR